MESIEFTKYDRMVEAHDDSQSTLTFGVELEFLVAVVKFGQRDPQPDEDRAPFRCDTENGYKQQVQIDQQMMEVLMRPGYMPWRHSVHDLFRGPNSNIRLYDAWRLTNDSSLRYGQNWSPPEYMWIGREVTSEVMSSQGNDHVRKITDVCRSIRDARTSLNETTGVHVHVGLGDEPFSLLTLKKFVSLLWFIDEMLLGLHHPSRHNNRHCHQLRSMSALGQQTLEALRIAGDTLDPDQELVNAAPFKVLLDDVVRKGAMSEYFNFLVYIGLPTEAAYFQSRVQGYATSQEFFEGQEDGLLLVRRLTDPDC
ncbi:putative amidoligase enzyme-domain-containing protein [Whalleya microplaca]|nr:putative amidoligase enzyme-domain-containing protein [Whalleya microplaca]